LAPPSHRILRCADEQVLVTREREQKTERHLEARGEGNGETTKQLGHTTAGLDGVCRFTETAGDLPVAQEIIQ